MSSNTEATNPYIALREAKIARNEAKLAQLGLLRPSVPAKSNAGVRAHTKVQKRQVAPKPALEPTRRSTRLSQHTDQPNYKELVLPDEGYRKRPRVVADDANDKVLISPPSAAVVRQPSTPASNSVRSIDINVDKLLMGEHGLLGKMAEHPGKEHVINKAFELASTTEDQQRLSGTRLSFNKYCGVQEWNNAVFLWVNLGSKDNTVVNDFLEDGKQITWFGGSRMYDDSPVIQKLLRLGKDASENASNIVLWVRRYDAGLKKFSPYICLGRLSYHSHQPGSHPLAFVWTLIDSELLKNHPDIAVKEEYETLIRL
jgi:hypothetical protein